MGVLRVSVLRELVCSVHVWQNLSASSFSSSCKFTFRMQYSFSLTGLFLCSWFLLLLLRISYQKSATPSCFLRTKVWLSCSWADSMREVLGSVPSLPWATLRNILYLIIWEFFIIPSLPSSTRECLHFLSGVSCGFFFLSFSVLIQVDLTCFCCGLSPESSAIQKMDGSKLLTKYGLPHSERDLWGWRCGSAGRALALHMEHRDFDPPITA